MEVVSRGSRQQASGHRALSTNPVEQSVKKEQSTPISKQDAKIVSSPSAFDPLIHKKPALDRFGYNKETHKGRELLNRNAKNILNEQVNEPNWWKSKNIRDTRFRSTIGLPVPSGDDTLKSPRLTHDVPVFGSTIKSNYSLGKNLSLNIQPQDVFMGLPEKLTRSKMYECRKKEALPDISYDLDGDGYVGGRDYVVARRFDEGFKNYLTVDERQRAIDAVKNGFEEKFVWNIEASGSNRDFRIMQQRGKIIDGEDHVVLTGTFPEHPIHKVKPQLKTQTELTAYRKGVEKEDIRQKKTAKDQQVAHLQKVQFKDYYQPDSYVQNPKYTATWQKAEELDQTNRVRGGLLPKNVAIDTDKLVDPSIKWVDQPANISKTILLEKRKVNNLNDQQKFEKNFEHHLDGQARIENRENCIARLAFKGLDIVPYNQEFVKERRAKEMIEDMTKKFGDQVLGVHGAELPKFADNQKDRFYWTMQKSFNQSPRCQSLNELKQRNKFWAKRDEVLLADATGYEAPIDRFKQERHPQKSKYGLANKVNHENHWPNTDKIGEPAPKNGWRPLLKWSEQEASYKCQGPDRRFRTFDKVIDHAQTYDADEANRDQRMEETIIEQAPRALREELRDKIQQEKEFEKSLQIGFKRIGQPRFGSGGYKNQEQTDSNDKKQFKQDSGKDQGNGNQGKGSGDAKTDSNTAVKQTQNQNNIVTTMFSQTGKGSLMQRIASPNQTVSKFKGNMNQTGATGSTMAATGTMGGTMQNTGKLRGLARNGSGMSSPFRETIARGMVTGVGLLGKTQ